jgi:hypothetical protein
MSTRVTPRKCYTSTPVGWGLEASWDWEVCVEVWRLIYNTNVIREEHYKDWRALGSLVGIIPSFFCGFYRLCIFLATNGLFSKYCSQVVSTTIRDPCILFQSIIRCHIIMLYLCVFYMFDNIPH